MPAAQPASGRMRGGGRAGAGRDRKLPNQNKMKEIKTKRTFCFRRWNRKGWSVFASMHRPVTLGVLSVSMSILLPATLVAQTQTSDSLTVLRIMQIDEVGVTGNLASPTRSAMTHTSIFFP